MLSTERIEERLAAAKPGKQRSRMEELIKDGKDVYADKIQGKSIIDSFRRYCDTRDPDAITNGLYRWSINGAGGLNDIAHYDIHGFRAEYPHPAVYLERLLYPEMNRGYGWRSPEDYHALHVYTDGLTSGDVRFAIREIADARREALLRDIADEVRRRDEAQLKELAARLGYTVEPIPDA